MEHQLRDTSLADNCRSQEYSDKVHLLLTKHLPHFETLRWEGTVLTDALIAFMPECNAQEGRAIAIRRGMIKEGKHDDHKEAARRCLEMVSESADMSREDARMAALMLSASPHSVSRPWFCFEVTVRLRLRPHSRCSTTRD